MSSDMTGKRTDLKKAWEFAVSSAWLVMLFTPIMASAVGSIVAFVYWPGFRAFIIFAWIAVIAILTALVKWEKRREARVQKQILDYCATAGCMNVKIQAFKNHFRVTYAKGAQQSVAKCRLNAGRIEWLTGDPN